MNNKTIIEKTKEALDDLHRSCYTSACPYNQNSYIVNIERFDTFVSLVKVILKQRCRK